MSLAPILLFVYNRPHHTKQTIEALQKNELANKSDLIIYSDAPKDEKSKKSVEEVREYIKTIDGFKNVMVIEREKNFGLADSIIDGVTKVVNKHDKVIVLEDDLITSPYFLQFMNEALEFYKDEKKVWHISGWSYPIEYQERDTFLWRVMNCWGWATWQDRWCYYKKDVDDAIQSFSKEDIKRFNLDGVENFWGQVEANRRGDINTWAIFWYATIFKHGGLSLNPVKSFVKNSGLDGSGIHCGENDIYSDMQLSYKKEIEFRDDIKEDSIAVKRIKKYILSQKKPLYIRAINKLSRKIFGRNVIL